MDEPGNERSETNQRAIDALHHRWQQIFVVAGEQRLVGRRGADHLQVTPILVHLARADLESADTRQRASSASNSEEKDAFVHAG